MVERFEEGGRPLLTVLRLKEPFPADAIEFFTAPEDLLQVGLTCRPKGHAVPVHAHNPVERRTFGTAEFLLVLDGMIAVTAFGETATKTFRLGVGDAVLVHPGCVHKVRWSTDARVLELKNGPYADRVTDKDEGG